MIATSFSRQKLLQAVRTMPAAPRILAQLGGLLVDTNIELADVTRLVKWDTALTTGIMRVANSVTCNPGQSVASLEEALVRVGFNEIYRLTGFAAAARMSEQYLELYAIDGAHLRENSLLTALVMEALAERIGVDSQAAYTAGLLRSIGKIALDRIKRESSALENYEGFRDGALAEWESTVVGLNNCEAAAIVLAEWHFPSETITAIREHYAPGADSSSLAHLLNLAAGAAERCGHGLPGELRYWNSTPENFARAEVSEGQLDEATRDALEAFGPVRSALG